MAVAANGATGETSLLIDKAPSGAFFVFCLSVPTSPNRPNL